MDVKQGAIVLRGGPFDGTRLNDESGSDVALVELETDGLIHRYVPTSHTQEVDGDRLAVYQFDGVTAVDDGA